MGTGTDTGCKTSGPPGLVISMAVIVAGRVMAIRSPVSLVSLVSQIAAVLQARRTGVSLCRRNPEPRPVGNRAILSVCSFAQGSSCERPRDGLILCATRQTKGETTMTDGPDYGFDTLQIHAGARPDPATGARQVPIYQTTAYVFRDADHAAALFNLQEVGYIYSRLTNPTVAALQERMATLEGGAGAVCCSSGHAAQIMALFPLMGPGTNVVASTRLYGGTVTQFSQTIKRFGWTAKFVDFDDHEAVAAAIDDDTRAVFCEAIANPGGHIADLRAIADIADAAGIPLIIDNTTATPYLCRPIEHGATLVVHSTTKYLTGNGTVTGGCVVDSGKFDWMASDKFPSLSQPEPAYHGLCFGEALGPMAFTFHGIAVGLRDLGMTLNPQAAHYTLLGIETLSLRMKRHVENAEIVSKWLEGHDA